MSAVRWFYGFLEGSDGLNKYFKGVTMSAGAANANDVPVLGPDGKLSLSFFPEGVGQPVVVDTVATGANLTANDWVYFDPTPGTGGVKPAIATSFISRAVGFVKSNVNAGGMALVYLGGLNSNVGVNAVKGEKAVLSTTSPGKSARPADQTTYAAGQLYQELGDLPSATMVNFGSNGVTAVFS